MSGFGTVPLSVLPLLLHLREYSYHGICGALTNSLLVLPFPTFSRSLFLFDYLGICGQK